MKKLVLALCLVLPMSASAQCIGSNNSSCTDVFKMATNEGYFVRFDVNNKGKVVKGKVEGRGLRCGITYNGGKIRKETNTFFGRVYYTCGTLNIIKMFGADQQNYDAIITESFGVQMSGSVKQK